MLKRLVICLYFALCLDPNLYEECKELCSQTKGLIACDGSFPICVGQAFPIDGLGKQHHVIDVGFVMTGSVTSRKIIAASNHLSPPDQHSSKIFIFLKTKVFWLCARCTTGSNTLLDVWGKRVIAPALHSRIVFFHIFADNNMQVHGKPSVKAAMTINCSNLHHRRLGPYYFLYFVMAALTESLPSTCISLAKIRKKK